jgi:hypothetical protein
MAANVRLLTEVVALAVLSLIYILMYTMFVCLIVVL